MHIISYNNPRRVQICSYLEAAASQTTMKLWMFDQATLQANDTPFATAHPFQKRWWWHYSLAFGQWHHKNMVGGIPTPLKNMKVRWDHEIPNFFMGSQLEVHSSSHHQPENFSEASIHPFWWSASNGNTFLSSSWSYPPPMTTTSCCQKDARPMAISLDKTGAVIHHGHNNGATTSWWPPWIWACSVT